MMEADEVLVTSSSKLIVPACEIDGIKVGGKAPNIVKLLQDEYYKKVDLETSLWWDKEHKGFVTTIVGVIVDIRKVM